MTNRIAFWLALCIALLIGLDLWFGWGGSIYLFRKLLDLVNVLVFWR